MEAVAYIVACANKHGNRDGDNVTTLGDSAMLNTRVRARSENKA